MQRVRRHRPSDLLPALARVALTVADVSEKSGWLTTPPWALAAAAKASICFGNEFRRAGVTDQDVIEICAYYFNMFSAEVASDPDLGVLEADIGRVAYEQFPYQESMFEEVARTRALLIDGLEEVPTKVITKESLQALWGATVEQFVGVGLLLHAVAQVNHGHFNFSLFEQDDALDIFAEIPKEVITAVVEGHFACSTTAFQAMAAEPPPHRLLPETAFNPLLARPFIDMGGGDLLAPQPSLILRRVTPGGIYYDGQAAMDTAFTEDLGLLFENYIGRQSRSLPGVKVLPEIVYDRGMQKSIDWFLLFDNLTLLIEVKITRLPINAKAGTVALPTMIKRTLGKMADQVQTTLRCLRDGTPEFAEIPRTQPFLAIAVTLEPYYMANSPLIRRHLTEPEIPLIVASAREFEMLIAFGQAGDIPELLTEITKDEDRSRWNLATAIAPKMAGIEPNPVLDHAFSQYPWASAACDGAKQSRAQVARQVPK